MSNATSQDAHGVPVQKDLDLITCVLQRGKGDKLVKAAMNAGASGATIFFARGMGLRERLGLLGFAIVPEKEVVAVVCDKKSTERIFAAVVKAGKLDLPGMGIAYVQPISMAVGLVETASQQFENK
jgi:nitrogen regulatory protein P-II 1